MWCKGEFPAFVLNVDLIFGELAGWAGGVAQSVCQQAIQLSRQNISRENSSLRHTILREEKGRRKKGNSVRAGSLVKSVNQTSLIHKQVSERVG